MQQARCIQKMIDEDAFRSSVLRSPPDMTEDEIDHRLELEAHVLGLQYRLPGAGPLTSSTSAMTIASDPEEPSSAISQSTGPTSCSSSDRRHTFQPSSVHPPPVLSTRSITPSLYSITEKKATALRNGIRIMSVFRKRRSATSRIVDTPTSNEHGVRDTAAFEDYSTKESFESPVSATSEQSSWSTPIPPIANIRIGDSSLEDSEAIERTTQCAAVQDLQSRQHDERDRFLHYQRECLVSLRAEHEKSRKEKIESKKTILKETKIKVLTDPATSLMTPFLIASEREIHHRPRIPPTRSRNEVDGRPRGREARLRHPPQTHGSLLSQSHHNIQPYPPTSNTPRLIPLES